MTFHVIGIEPSPNTPYLHDSTIASLKWSTVTSVTNLPININLSLNND